MTSWRQVAGALAVLERWHQAFEVALADGKDYDEACEAADNPDVYTPYFAELWYRQGQAAA